MNFKNILGYCLVGTVSLVCVWGLIGGCKSESGISFTDADKNSVSIEIAEAEFFRDDKEVLVSKSEIAATVDEEIQVVSDEDLIVLGSEDDEHAYDFDKVYKVAKGDTLWWISRECGVSVEMLMAANNITDASRLQVGQEILIP